MGLASALYATVSALRGQSTAIANVSENIANSSTTAYKIRTISFQALVGDTGGGGNSGGGVLTRTSQAVSSLGQITTTGVSTNIAIKGQGFFVVSSALTNRPAAFTFSRNGNFSTDSGGNLISDEGYYLMGQVTDNQGVVTATNTSNLNSLVPINVAAVQGAASATTAVTEKMNLPADAAVGDSFTTSFEVFDSQGVSSTVTQTFAKTAANGWTMTLSQPEYTNNPGVQSGTLAAPLTYAFTFNGDGSLATPATSPALSINFSIPTLTATGANTSAITLNIGTAGDTDGITQFAANSTNPQIEIAGITSNGVRFGKLTSIEINDSGLVTAVFDNGLRQPMFQVPIATFPNPNGLRQINGSIYDENQDAGIMSLQNPGSGSAGALVSKALESSATDISEEFNKLIVAQQAYSASAQIITAVRTLNDTLNQAIR